MEENNVPSTPKLICPKGKSSYVGCFQTNFEFSLPRESCRQRSANEGEKCNFVGGNIEVYPRISSLESCQDLCYNDPSCVAGKWEDSWETLYSIDASNTTLDNVGSADFNAKFWSSESRLLKRICSTCSPEYERYIMLVMFTKEYSIDVYEELIGSFMSVKSSPDNLIVWKCSKILGSIYFLPSKMLSNGKILGIIATVVWNKCDFQVGVEFSRNGPATLSKRLAQDTNGLCINREEFVPSVMP